MILTHKELVKLVKDGVITNVKKDQIQGSSIDVTLGDTLLIEQSELDCNGYKRSVFLRERKPLDLYPVTISEVCFYSIKPNEFLLGCTEQKFFMPNNISAEYKTTSSMGRIGLNHMASCWIDAGFTNSVLTLELNNATRFTNICVKKGDRIGQIIFHKHDPIEDKYLYSKKGHYNNLDSVSGVI